MMIVQTPAPWTAPGPAGLGPGPGAAARTVGSLRPTGVIGGGDLVTVVIGSDGAHNSREQNDHARASGHEDMPGRGGVRVRLALGRVRAGAKA